MRRNYTNQELAEMLKDDTFFISTLVNTIDGLAVMAEKSRLHWRQ